MLTRRDALKGIAAVPLAAAVPAAAVAAALPVAEPLAPRFEWSFNVRYGDYRDTVIAATKEEAHAKMIAEHFQRLNRKEASRGLARICKMYGSVKATGADGKTVVHVWDYAADRSCLETEMPRGSERWKASERAKFKQAKD